MSAPLVSRLVGLPYSRKEPIVNTNNFVKIPTWLIQSPVSARAKALYSVLTFLKPDQEDDLWPTKKQIAELMGMNDPESLNKYIDELSAIEALEVTRVYTHDRLRRRNHYKVAV